MQVLKTRLISLTNRISPLLLLLCVTIFCWFLASIAWLCIAPPKAVSVPPVSLGSSTTKVSFNPSIFSVFKKPIQKPIAIKRPAVKPSNLMLQGIMRAVPKKKSKVIINNQNIIKSYYIGDKITNTDFTLTDIFYKEAVLEDSQGNEVRLDLYKEFDLNGSVDVNTKDTSTSNYSMPTPQQATSNMTAPLQQTLPPQSATREHRPKKKKVTNVKQQINNMLENAAEELENNPSNYLNKMGVVASDNGYTITGQMNSSMRRNIGLELGDQIISVNGQSLGQAQQDAALLKEIQRTRSAEIQVKRGSQVITIRQQF